MALADFDEIRFPEKIALNTTGGPEFFTTIVSTVGGFEQRNVNWEQARRRFRVEHALKDVTDTDELLNFFYARRGMAVGFRFRDWLDYASDMPAMIANPPSSASDNTLAATMTHQNMRNIDTGLLVGDGSETDFQLIKTYPATTGEDYVQTITKPAGTTSANAAVRVYVNSVLQTEGGGNDYTTAMATGIVTFAVAPPAAQTVTADFLYDVPVRFNVDAASLVKQAFDVNEWVGIEIVELRI